MRIRLLPPLAVLALAGCLSAPPVHPRALEENELCAREIGNSNLEKAEVHCDLGLQFSPQYSDLWVNKGLIALKRGNLDEAKGHFIKALRYNQEQAQAYSDLGYIYMQEHSYGRAHDNLQRALKVNPDYREARYNLGLCLDAMGKKEDARKEFLTLISIAPELADPRYELGRMAVEAKQYDEAVKQLSEATRLDPSYARAWLGLGVAYGELGKFAEAVEAEKACLEADPENASCRNNLAIHQRKAALLDPALQEIRDTRTAESSPESLYALGQTYRQRGLEAQEERAYKSCLKLDPRYPACHFGLWEIFNQQRKDRDAVIACKNFLKFAQTDDFPEQVQTCQKYLSASGN